jgi:catechol 2,3-dioxygenase-like lactoylglutathione lyase family enzyme
MLHIDGTLKAISIVTNTREQSLRFYTDGLGYGVLSEGYLTEAQRKAFGVHLGWYCLLGHAEGSVVRLLHTNHAHAVPHRIGAMPYDNGLCVFEAGTPDVERAYSKVLRARFGAIAPPTEFDCEAPEPLGYVLMRSTAFIGPSGEQVFVTQIVNRRGGESLLKEKAVDGINVPANVVISLRNRTQQAFYKDLLGIEPVNDLPLRQPGAAAIMGGPSDMGFQMCLMGYGSTRIGMEQHVYEPFHPEYEYRTYPTGFEHTGLASAAWRGRALEVLEEKLAAKNIPIVSKVLLPLRDNPTPKGLAFRGITGEMLEISDEL